MDFKEYNTIIKKSKLADFSYPLHGYYILTPTGVSLRNNLFNFIEKKINEIGYNEYDFPVIIHKEFLEHQKALEDFSKGTIWIIFPDDFEFKKKYLRPSGEGAIYPVVKNWIRNHNDLPIKILCKNLFFRPVRKQTAPFFIGPAKPMFEGHSFFESVQDINTELIKLTKIFKKSWDTLGLNTILIEIPKKGNKKISERSIGFMTQTGFGKPAMICMLYNQGELYSKVLKIEYNAKNGSKKNVNQLCFGFTDRPIGAMISTFSNRNNLCLSPEIVETQVAIICFIKKKSVHKHEILNICKSIKSKLIDSGFRAQVIIPSDGEKIFEKIENLGIPLRISFGEKELSSKNIKVFDTYFKNEKECGKDHVDIIVQTMLKTISKKLSIKSTTLLKKSINKASSIQELQNNSTKKLISEFSWCLSKKCQTKIEKTSNGEILGTKLNLKLKMIKNGKCIICGKNGFKSLFGLRI